MAHKIALNCGHGRSLDGSWDAGCVYGTYSEAALMLPITKSAVKYLRQSGFTVLSDADTDNDKNMVADVNIANRNKVEAYISIHCDYYKAPTGIYPLYVSTGGKKLATALNSAVCEGMNMKSRGIGKRTDLYELNSTDAVACIFEAGSIRYDIAKFKEYDKYGKCIAKGICNYFGVKFVESVVKKRNTATKRSTNRTKFVRALENIGEEIEKSFKYSNNNSKTTWSAAKKNHITNCARYVSWCLQSAGILSSGKCVYWKDGLRGSGASQLKSSDKVGRYKPNKTAQNLAKSGALKVGDICMFSNGNHTMVVDRIVKVKNKNKYHIYWYTAGPGDVRKHKVRNVRRSAYENRRVSYLVRIK